MSLLLHRSLSPGGSVVWSASLRVASSHSWLSLFLSALPLGRTLEAGSIFSVLLLSAITETDLCGEGPMLCRILSSYEMTSLPKKGMKYH